MLNSNDQGVDCVRQNKFCTFSPHYLDTFCNQHFSDWNLRKTTGTFGGLRDRADLERDMDMDMVIGMVMVMVMVMVTLIIMEMKDGEILTRSCPQQHRLVQHTFYISLIHKSHISSSGQIQTTS